MPAMSPTPAPRRTPFPCPGPDRTSLIKADSNCLGRGALLHHPELAELLAADPGDCLEYDDSRRDDGLGDRLRHLIGERENCSPARVLLGGSGLDRIPLIATSLGVKHLVSLEGDFHGYHRFSLLTGVKRTSIRVDARNRTITPEELALAVRDLDDAMLCLTFFVTNPLQTPITRRHIRAVIEANPKIKILIDGAYRQFGDQFHLAGLADEFEQVIYLQVASKDIFLPGARLSWIVPSARHAERLAQIQPPFPLSTSGVRQAVALLERPDLLGALRNQQRAARDLLEDGLRRLGLLMISGPAPWVLIQWPGSAKAFAHTLEHRFGILVQVQIHPPLQGDWVRITATTPEEASQINWAIMMIIIEGMAT